MLRNAIHDQLVDRCGHEDWWTNKHVRLCPNEAQAITTAIDTLTSRGANSPSANDVVAATSFALWVGLVGSGRPRDPLFSYETNLWQPRLIKAFPYAGGVRRKQIHDELNRIRALRNRVAHHEPIFNGPHAQLRDMVLALAGYIHPDARVYIQDNERISYVLATKKSAIVDGRSTF